MPTYVLDSSVYTAWVCDSVPPNGHARAPPSMGNTGCAIACAGVSNAAFCNPPTGQDAAKDVLACYVAASLCASRHRLCLGGEGGDSSHHATRRGWALPAHLASNCHGTVFRLEVFE